MLFVIGSTTKEFITAAMAIPADRGLMMRFLIPDPSLVLLIGPSGAGKSTFAARHFSPTEIVSSDRCRAMIADDESDQTRNHAVFALLHHIARARLAAGRLTVIDATNLEFRARRSLLRLARRHALPAIAFVFLTSPQTCRAQNRGRPDRRVPEDVITTQVRQLSEALSVLTRERYAEIHLLEEFTIGDVVIERIGHGPVGAGFESTLKSAF
jgi:predicted kinase